MTQLTHPVIIPYHYTVSPCPILVTPNTRVSNNKCQLWFRLSSGMDSSSLTFTPEVCHVNDSSTPSGCKSNVEMGIWPSVCCYLFLTVIAVIDVSRLKIDKECIMLHVQPRNMGLVHVYMCSFFTEAKHAELVDISERYVVDLFWVWTANFGIRTCRWWHTI